MRGRKIFTISLALAGLASAAQPDYFPLQPGNQWVYRIGGGGGDRFLTLEIARTGHFGGRTYSLLRGLPAGEFWLRMDEAGNLRTYSPERNLEELWYAFHAPEGEEYTTFLPGAPSQARIVSRRAAYKGPACEVDYALEVRYLPAGGSGIERELFLPYIGLVHRSEKTAAGRVLTYDLIYSRTGGVTVLSAPELSFSLTLDRLVYYANLMPPVDPARVVPEMTARLTLRNTTGVPLELVWPSGQRYDFQIRNEKGEVVWRWSDGRAFILLYGKEWFTGERNYTELIRLGEASTKPWPQGRYVLEGWLATEARAFTASAPFEIRHVH